MESGVVVVTSENQKTLDLLRQVLPSPRWDGTDFLDWVYDHNGQEKSCSYVGKKPSSRCEEVGGDGTTGYESCPLACDTCGTYTTGLLVDDDFLNQ